MEDGEADQPRREGGVMRWLLLVAALALGCLTNVETGEKEVDRAECKQTARDAEKAKVLACPLLFGGDPDRIEICIVSAELASRIAILACEAADDVPQ